MRRVQFLIPEDEIDRFHTHIYSGLRARVIRTALLRICEALEDPHSNLTPDDIIRGDFKITEYDHGNF